MKAMMLPVEVWVGPSERGYPSDAAWAANS